MKKNILITIFAFGFILLGGLSEAKAQGSCKNYLGRENQSLCTEKKDYDQCVGMLNEGKRDLCLWTGDPSSRIERATVNQATETLRKQGCKNPAIGFFECGNTDNVSDKAAYNVCLGYKNFGVVRGCEIALGAKTLKTARPIAFELGVQMGRLLYFAEITQAEMKKNNGMSKEYDKAFSARQTTIGTADKLIKSINDIIPDKTKKLDANKLWGYSDGKQEANSLTVASLMQISFGSSLTKNYKPLSEAFYFGLDMGEADPIIQNSDTAKRQKAIDSLNKAVNKAQQLSILNGAHSTIISEVKSANPLVNVYIKFFDLRTWYKEAIGKI